MEKRKRIALIALMLTTIVCIASILLFNRVDASQEKSWSVRVAAAEKQDISSSVSCSGVLEDSVHRDIFAEQPLKILKLYVEKGKTVKKGERLILYDTEQLRLQYEELKSAVDIQQKTLDSLKAAAEVGGSPALSDPYAGYGTKDLGFQEAMVSPSAGNTSAVRSNLDIQESNLDIQESNLESAKRKLESVGNLLKRISESSISPMEGIVSELNAVEGGFAAVQLPVIRLIRTDNMRVRAQVKEIDISRLKKGQYVEVTGDAMGSRQPVKGRVSEVSPIAVRTRTATGTETYVEALITLEGKTTGLIPGINVECKIFTDEKRRVTVIDFMSIREDKNGSKGVYIVDGSGRIRLKPVKLGISSDMKVEITYGLEEGDKVITNWQPGFKNGDKAKIKGEAD